MSEMNHPLTTKSRKNDRNAQSLRFFVKPLAQLFYQPRSVFDWIATESGQLWLPPMLLITLVSLLRILVGGWLQVQRVAQGELSLPPDWTYYTPEMQAQYMQAAEATKNPVFVYVLPVILGLFAIWLGWIIISSLLHLTFTMAGGGGTNASALNLVAWASVPFALRELLRVLYLLVARHPIVSAGLSGFIANTESSGWLFVSTLLAFVDIFLVWHITLLVIGAKRTETITTAKSFAVVMVVTTLSLLTQAGTSYLGSQLGNMMVTRPFYF